jgi:hypothetical protein
MTDYLKNRKLEIVFVDDNCPITGIERGGSSKIDDTRCDDHIGTAFVELDSLLQGISINKEFKIEVSRKEDRGKV